MNGNAELLNFVYQNSQMGIDTLSQIMEMTDDEKLKDCLKRQKEKYEEFHKEAERLLHKKGHDEKSLSMFDKLRTYFMINVSTITDKTASHLAQMLIEGSSMGVTNALQDLRKYENADEDARHLMKKLYQFEEENVEKYKRFL